MLFSRRLLLNIVGLIPREALRVRFYEDSDEVVLAHCTIKVVGLDDS